MATETPVTEKGYINNLGVTEVAVRSLLAPYISTVSYRVAPYPSYAYDTSKNEVAILNTYMDVTAEVVRNGRNIKTAVFRTVHKNGSYEDRRVPATYIGQDEFTTNYKLDTSFEPRDMLYISFIDNIDLWVIYRLV